MDNARKPGIGPPEYQQRAALSRSCAVSAACEEKEAFAAYTVTPDIVQFIPNFKKVALSCAARAYNADAIIGATVDVITNANGHLEITISGYPAKYTNFRNATSEDMNLVQEGLNLMKQNNTDILSIPTDQTRLNVEITK